MLPRSRSPLTSRAPRRSAVIAALVLTGAACARPRAATAPRPLGGVALPLPTGAHLDPAVSSIPLGSMPLGIALAPDSVHAAVVLSGSREQGVQIVDLAAGRVTQTLLHPAAFIGAVFSRDGRALYVSGGNSDLIYRYVWDGRRAVLADSIVLAPKASARAGGTRYPAGLALSADGRTLYAAENLADSLAVVDVAARRVTQRLPVGRYPYAVAVAPDGTVYASAWGGNTVAVFTRTVSGALVSAGSIPVARHPSALLLNRDGSRLFAVSGSTDRVDVVDTRARLVLTELSDAPPAGPNEGTTPNALALSPDGTRLYVAEGDANAVALFTLSPHVANVGTAPGADRLVGRVPTEWYPTALALRRDTLVVVTGKGRGTGPNPGGPNPISGEHATSREYTLSQTIGSLAQLPPAVFTGGALAANTARVLRANGWDRTTRADAAAYPPFRHVIYVIKENRTYDQVFGDLAAGDGDSTLLFFPRAVSPNHHALAERFGIFDRFFVNAEVSADGHNWSTAAYATDYVEKTVPSEYSGRGRTYDYEGTNGGFGPKHIPDDDVAAPALGYLWDAAQRAGITYRDYGEFVVRTDENRPGVPGRYAGNKRALAGHTAADYPGFDLTIRDQVRVDAWLREFRGFVRDGDLPALEIVRLPNDHTAGARAGAPTPLAYMADNDLALGRMVQAISTSPYWRNTVIFVVEDDAQNGPDHVDSHRAPFLAISAYGRGGVVHRWASTSDVIATISEILHLPALSQFEYYGRPLREIFASQPDLRPYRALTPAVPLDRTNPRGTAMARASARLDLSQEDRADENAFNRILWRTIRGDVPYPGIHRMSAAVARESGGR